ncbi:hypothetical protein I3760_15G103100 [Carya illinoinensis]|nr:hypothetical protein I3760_15G103100 [Carya illinoinensis]
MSQFIFVGRGFRAESGQGKKGLGQANVQAYQQQGLVVKPQILVVPRFLWNRGYLVDKNKPIIFSMAQLDTAKNIIELTKWYGKNEKLRSLVNLIVSLHPMKLYLPLFI